MSGGLPHIHALPDELIWHIFMLNTEEDYSYYQVDAARSASQVCRRWRGIALNSAALWGRLIHSTFFLQTDAQWRREVLRRTGTAPLWLTVCNGEEWRVDDVATSAARAVVGDIVLPLLDTRWTDIERLVLWLEGDDSELDDLRWSKLLSPAPNMRHLFLDFDQLPKFLRPGLANAPRFRPSLYNLRKLTLWNAAFSPSTIFDILEDMPLLTVLSLGRDEEENDAVPTTARLPCLDSIHLPYLDQLEMRHILGAAIVIMPRIIASPSCKLRLSSSCSPDFDCEEQHKLPFKNALHRFTSSYLAPSVARTALGKTLVLDLEDDFLRFAASRWLMSPAYIDIEDMPFHEYHIKICTLDGDARPDLPGWLVDAITSALFAIRPPPGPDVFILHVYNLAPSCANSCLESIAQFALSMDIVEVLQEEADMLLRCVLQTAREQIESGANQAARASLPYLRMLYHTHDTYSRSNGLLPLLYEALSCAKRRMTSHKDRRVYYNFAGSKPSNTTGLVMPACCLQDDDVVAAVMEMSIQKL